MTPSERKAILAARIEVLKDASADRRVRARNLRESADDDVARLIKLRDDHVRERDGQISEVQSKCHKAVGDLEAEAEEYDMLAEILTAEWERLRDLISHTPPGALSLAELSREGALSEPSDISDPPKLRWWQR